jgi:hypothetical protein
MEQRMSILDACLIVEGETEVETREEWVEAVQFLWDMGMIPQLQGFYQRTASDLIASGELIVS